MTRTELGGAWPIMRRIHLTAILLPLFFACEVPAENAGAVVDGDAQLGEVVERPLESGDSHRMLVLPPSSRVRHLVRSGDGVLAVTGVCCDEEKTFVSELDGDMQTRWTLDLGDVGVSDVAPLDDGGWLLSGVSPGGSDDTAIWKLSCCGELEAKHEYRDFPEDSSGVGVRPLGDGFVLATYLYNDESPRMRWTFLDQEFNETSVTESPFSKEALILITLRRTPNDTVVAILSYMTGPSTILEVSGPGEVSSRMIGAQIDAQVVPVGDGADLGWMVLEEGQPTFTRYSGVTTPTALFDRLPLAIPDRRSHIAFFSDDATGNYVAEIADDGTVLRRVTLPDFSPEALFGIPFAVAVAEDDSIFAGIDEVSEEFRNRAVIHHLPAL